MMNKLENHYRKLLKLQLENEIGLPALKADSIANLYKLEILNKGDFIVKEDGFANKIIFLHQGYIRCFVANSDKEITHWVYWKDRWVTDFPSFKKFRVSPWSFQALTDCVIHSLTYSDYLKIKDLMPTWDNFENKLLFKLFMALEHRIFTFISMNATERYLYLHNAHPNIFNEIPLIYLSSLLNMTPETLSRIRRKMIS
jgi:CRP/FNR family transcriptional regulator, anaerobic regulatory protein